MPTVDNVKADVVTNLLAGNSCATLETVINKAGMYAGFYGKKKIEMDDIVQAFLDVKYGVGREQEKLSKEVEDIGVHEAGHAVVAEILLPESVNLAVLKRMNMRWGARGFVSRVNDKIDLEPFKKSEYDIMIGLAGKAATEVLSGSVDMGCNHDLYRVYDEAAKLVDNVCAYGFDTFVRHDSGKELKDKKDYQISKLVEAYYKKVVKLLENNKEFLAEMTKELIEKRVLVRTDIDRIKERVVINNV